jgi:hypothetical protein
MCGSGNPANFGGIDPNGPVLFGQDGGILGITRGTEKSILQWSNSNVLINTSLSVLGSTSVMSNLNVSGIATLSGGLTLSNVNKNPIDNYTITENDTLIYYDDISGTFKTIIFPSANGNFNGKIIVITNKTSNKLITLSGTGNINNYILTMGDTITVIGISGWGWLPIGFHRSIGQVINVSWVQLSGTDKAMTNASWDDIISTTYTPISVSSTIIIECNLVYTISGSAGDELNSRIYINNSTEIGSSKQLFNNASGGGTRGGILFPLSGSYTNSSTNTITIALQFNKVSSDDIVTFHLSTWPNSNNIKITEISR